MLCERGCRVRSWVDPAVIRRPSELWRKKNSALKSGLPAAPGLTVRRPKLGSNLSARRMRRPGRFELEQVKPSLHGVAVDVADFGEDGERESSRVNERKTCRRVERIGETEGSRGGVTGGESRIELDSHDNTSGHRFGNVVRCWSRVSAAFSDDSVKLVTSLDSRTMGMAAEDVNSRNQNEKKPAQINKNTGNQALPSRKPRISVSLNDRPVSHETAETNAEFSNNYSRSIEDDSQLNGEGER